MDKSKDLDYLYKPDKRDLERTLQQDVQSFNTICAKFQENLKRNKKNEDKYKIR